MAAAMPTADREPLLPRVLLGACVPSFIAAGHLAAIVLLMIGERR